MTKCFGCLPGKEKDAYIIYRHENQEYALCFDHSLKAANLGWKRIRRVTGNDVMTKTVEEEK